MALNFYMVEENYCVEQVLMSWSTTEIMRVLYTPDLMKCKIEKDPWRETTEATKHWFNKYYRHKF